MSHNQTDLLNFLKKFKGRKVSLYADIETFSCNKLEGLEHRQNTTPLLTHSLLLILPMKAIFQKLRCLIISMIFLKK